MSKGGTKKKIIKETKRERVKEQEWFLRRQGLHWEENKVKKKRKYSFKTDKRLISDACGSRYYFSILINLLMNWK